MVPESPPRASPASAASPRLGHGLTGLAGGSSSSSSPRNPGGYYARTMSSSDSRGAVGASGASSGSVAAGPSATSERPQTPKLKRHLSPLPWEVEPVPASPDSISSWGKSVQPRRGSPFDDTVINIVDVTVRNIVVDYANSSDDATPRSDEEYL